MLHWGVDSSYYPANATVGVPDDFLRGGEVGPVEEPLFDYVTRRAGRQPEFWGRYLNDNHPDSRLRPDEPSYLFSRNCRLLLLFNGIRTQPHGQDRDRSGGENAAHRAIAEARRYNIANPSQVRIYLDLEDYSVTAGFLEGWWNVMYASPYAGAGGLYGRGAEQAVPRRGSRGSHLRDFSRRPYNRNWAQRVSIAEDRVAEQRIYGLLDDLASGYRHISKPHSVYIWSNTPRRYDQSHDTPADTEIIPPAFGAVGPYLGREGSLLTQTVIWQYRFGAFWERGASRGTVDLDLALDAAFDNMWRRS